MSAVLFSSIALDRLSPRGIVSLQKSRDRVQPRETLTGLTNGTGTRRNLFGPVDHDELRRELTSKLKEISERDRLRWNFDFGDGRPLDGQLEWEESPARDCPAFYRERIVTRTVPLSEEPKGERVARVAPHDGGRAAPVTILNRENEADGRKARNSRRSVAHVRTKRPTDLRITDFYGKRRTGGVKLKEGRTVE